jgi:hypothetical protein
MVEHYVIVNSNALAVAYIANDRKSTATKDAAVDVRPVPYRAV